MWLFVRGHPVIRKVSCHQLAVLWLKCIVGHWCRHMSDCIPDTKSSTRTHIHTHTPLTHTLTPHSCWDNNKVTYLSAANILKWADTLKHSPTRVKHRWPRTAAPKSAPFIKIQKRNRHKTNQENKCCLWAFGAGKHLFKQPYQTKFSPQPIVK